MEISESESVTVEYDDGIELIVERRGSRVSLVQRVWIDDLEEPEEWEIGEVKLAILE